MLRGLKSTTAALVLAFLVALAGASAVLLLQDHLATALSSWIGGEPKSVVRLEVRIPKVEAGRCYVVVERFPSPSRPTGDDLPEVVHFGEHSPGETVVVRESLRATVRTGLDRGTGGRADELYEPAEYLVMVMCAGAGGTYYKYGGIHEVYPRSAEWTHEVEVEFVKERPTRWVFERPWSADSAAQSTCSLGVLSGGISSSSRYVRIGIFEVYRSDEAWSRATGVCHIYVKGPMLYSLEGLSVSFGLTGGPRPSAVYLEAYYDISPLEDCRSYESSCPGWKSAGRKLVVAERDAETSPLTGNLRDRVYFGVTYGCLQRCYLGQFQLCWWTLYPRAIGEVRTSWELVARGVLPPAWSERDSYHPPPAPPHASRASDYGLRIFFGEHGTGEAGGVLASTVVRFTVASSIPSMRVHRELTRTTVTYVTVSGGFTERDRAVNFYGVGRHDSSYTTPYVKVVNPAGRAYQFWFRDGNPMTYEILLRWH